MSPSRREDRKRRRLGDALVLAFPEDSLLEEYVSKTIG